MLPIVAVPYFSGFGMAEVVTRKVDHHISNSTRERLNGKWKDIWSPKTWLAVGDVMQRAGIATRNALHCWQHSVNNITQ
jgi:hypothetical protein